jgi:hypothetical protein
MTASGAMTAGGVTAVCGSFVGLEWLRGFPGHAERWSAGGEYDASTRFSPQP